MKKIVGFGDSFVYGSEIDNNRDGRLGWPGIAASKLSVDYETTAIPGCGNDSIARQIYSYFANHSSADTLAVINWTWTQRWDFYLTDKEHWITLGPSCLPSKLENFLSDKESQRLVDFYQDYANASLLWNKIRNLQTIVAAQSFLKLHNVVAVQTYMDSHLFDVEWHAPDYVQQLQAIVKTTMLDWQGRNFVDWARSRGHTVTDPGNHPLLSAHIDAADFWQDRYSQLLF